MTHGTRFFTNAMRLALKEWRLLLRNPHGLAVLFVMPAIFVLVMSFTLKNTLTSNVDLPPTGWVLEDHSPVVAHWEDEWLAAHGGLRFGSRTELRSALESRKVDAGVVIAPGDAKAAGPRVEQLEIWLGNLVQPAAAARLRTELAFSVYQAQMKASAASLGPFSGLVLGGTADTALTPAQGPKVRYLYELQSGRRMTAVQQSVPAWLIFGMFFVVIPIAGVLIQERNDGTLARLATFKVTPAEILGGKLLAFILLNWIQLGFMILIGRWVVPLLGGDALNLDFAPAWFVVMIVSTSLCAIGLALLIAAVTETFDHAAALGSGINVVLAAIAGVMVPRMLMPPGLQRLSEMTPMAWALDGLQSVFLGAPSPEFVWGRAGLLLAFACACLAVAWRALVARSRR
jgi:ABC-2 type transport system permease protein